MLHPLAPITFRRLTCPQARRIGPTRWLWPLRRGSSEDPAVSAADAHPPRINNGGSIRWSGAHPSPSVH
eukprot:3496867-Pyramimonas_sp.AAC.2